MGGNHFVFRRIEDMTPFYHKCKALSSRSPIIYSCYYWRWWRTFPAFMGIFPIPWQSVPQYFYFYYLHISLSFSILSQSFLPYRLFGRKEMKWEERFKNIFPVPRCASFNISKRTKKKKKKKSKLHASWNTILTLESIYSHFVYWIKGHFWSIIIIRSNKEDLNMILLVEDINQCYLTIQRG